jgi:surface protein
MTSLNLGSFITSEVADMSSMFAYCENVEKIDMNKFDTSNVLDMGKCL